jgi:hypothetical protein
MDDGDDQQDTPNASAMDVHLTKLFEIWAAEPMSEGLEALVARLQSDGDIVSNF